MKFIDAAAIARVMNWHALVEHLRAEHRGAPPRAERLVMREQTDALLVLPAWVPGRSLGIKLVTSFPGNTDAPAIQGIYVLFDGSDGTPRLLLDGAALTLWKTAADSALAADHLARGDARTLLMVGAGALAPYLVRAHCAQRPSIAHVLLWNRRREKSQTLAASLAPLPAQCVDALDDAVPLADIICCATGAREPLIRGALLREGVHLDLVGGFTPDMREADDDALRRSRVFVDWRETTVGVVGDLPASAHVEGDLYDLCSGRAAGRRDACEITFFKSGGGAHLDLMTARFVAERMAQPHSR